MVNYWYYTRDDTWNDQTKQALVFQSAPAEGGYFEPNNQTLQLGNDDQAFWGLAAMEAAEYNFPNPPSSQPQWLEMAQGVFNRQYGRWDPKTCGGGMRWQVFTFNNGFNYKNSISNGCFFNLAARLGKYTGNQTYIDAANQWYEWSVNSGLIDTSANYRIVDGITVESCNDYGHTDQWTYNVGVYLYGAAAMWNATQDPVWQQRTQGLLDGTSVFFKSGPAGNVLTEVICEPQQTCKVDQSSFKAYLARWMTSAATVAPFIADQVRTTMLPSAQAAAAVCNPGGQNGGATCGQKWYTGSFDGKTGIGMQMNAMEVIQTLLSVAGPVTHTQGTSKGDASAGTGDGQTIDDNIIKVSTGDKAGASILTILLTLTTIGGGIWIVK